MSAKYWIAQHVEDLFRNEPRNIGVFVQIGSYMSGKFVGEMENNEIDGRKIKSFAYPNVYKQWVEYWRSAIDRNPPDDLTKASGSHYRVIEAGQISDIDSDSPEYISQFLYSMLVSEGGYKEAIQDNDAENDSALLTLENELIQIFNSLDLLSASTKHPIIRNKSIEGRTVIHKPSFVQENGALYIIESVDFTTSQKARSRDHAGYSAYMFNDIKNKRHNAEPISIVRVREQDMEIEEVRNSLIILRNESEVIDWYNEVEKNLFIKKRQTIATL